MRTFILLSTLVGAAIVVGALSPSGGVDARPAPAIEDRPARGSAPTLAPPRFTVGTSRVYDTKARHDVTLEQEGRPGTSFTVELSGTWRLTVAAIEPDRILLRGELAAASLVIGAAANQPELVAALARPHAIALSPSGKLLSIHMAPDRDGLVEGLVRSLAAAIQLVDVDSDASQWTTAESDANGDYVAAYHRGGDVLEKSKLRYTRVNGMVEVRALTSRTTAQLDPAHWPTRLDASERTTTSVSSGPVMTASTHTTLALTETATVQVAGFDLTGLEVVGSPSARAAQRADRELLAGATLETLLAELASADDHARAELQGRIMALLRLEPGAASDIGRRIVEGADASTASVLLGALADAGTADAQATLVDLLGRDTLTTGDRSNVAVAMAMLETPFPEITEALTQNLDHGDPELRTTSGLALGTAARRLTASDRSRAAHIVEDVLERLAATTAPEQQVMLLMILGNAGDPAALPAMRGLLGSTSPAVRRAAVEALRSIHEPTVDGLIARMLLDDPEASVREGAAFSCGYRPVDGLLVALDRALGDRDAQVRMTIVEVLGRNREVAGATRLLERVARLDPLDDIRVRANRLLGAS